MAVCPENAEFQTAYAADVYAAPSSTSSMETADALIVHAELGRDRAEGRGIQISAHEIFATLFTSDTHQSPFDPTITLNYSRLPLERHP